MSRLAASIVLLWGWRRIVLAFGAGALTALALAPFDLWPVAFITIPVFVWLIDGSAPREGVGFIRRLLPAAAIGWWFGFGYFLAGMWWIGGSFLVDAERFAWMAPFAVLALTAGLAILWALGAAMARLFWTDGWPRVFAFAAVMTLIEWLRGHMLTGFPWSAFGYTLTAQDQLMQSASVIGLWGLTLLAFLTFAIPVLLVRDDRRFGRWAALFGLTALALGNAAYGFVRLGSASEEVVEGVRLRIVQPNVSQQDKANPALDSVNLSRHLQLSTGEGLAGITHVIWPETAIPYVLTDAPGNLAAIGAMLPPGVTLITGSHRAIGAGDRAVTNSILVINDRGEIVDSYDKVHLVPFGEYLPFADVLEPLGIRQIIPLPGGFAAGLERRTLTAGAAPPFAPLICYEAIFPGAVVAEGARPEWLLNATNDAWFGDSQGPRQHFRQARLRAVEEGLPLVRAANTGISAIVDAYGRVQTMLEVGAEGAIDGDLPRSLAPTLYVKYRDAVPAGLAFLSLFTAFVGSFGAGRRNN